VLVELLRHLGVTHGQGFYLGKPRLLDEFVAELYQRPEAASITI
jgi:EAL domain-containing protein (putative c-di-GMP-specific phosphodiesterase class I)